jgi:uncharacterized protein (DUF1800 family)
MALSREVAQRARIAVQRFGLGPRPGTLAAIADDPQKAVLDEIARPESLHLRDRTLPVYRTACAESQRGFSRSHAIFEREMRARFRKAVAAPIGFGERLVHFWSNHFSMSVEKAETIRGTVGQLEREVIRVHALGSFADMLVGVMKHPAMIAFLDNENSIGPRSVIGRSWRVGHNQNLAREALELHTLGVGGGYGEDDVEAMARMLTGWSYVQGWQADHNWQGGSAANRGQFLFRPDWHEPGAQTLLGVSYRAGGLEQAEAALRALARHPKTAEHLAFKMLAHFLTDTPTRAMVRRLSKAYLDGGSDLGAMTRALVTMPQSWVMPLAKLRTPYELAIAQFRSIELASYSPSQDWAVLEPLRALRHMPFHRGPPDGYPDETTAWLEPDGMRIRVETAKLFASQFARERVADPVLLADELFDTALSAPSRRAITRASDAHHALVALFSSPEFQRR